MERRPHFLVIGAQKSGTTSLYLYLQRHPHLHLDASKEVHYFDREEEYPDHEWYRRRFAGAAEGQITGEMTPIYCFWPGAIERIWDYDHDLKLIMLVRNPIDRAVSQYWMSRRNEREALPIEEAFDAEIERLATGDSYAIRHHSYLARGRYAEQLSVVSRYFPRRQLLLLRTKDLDCEPAQTLRKLTDFLGIEALHDEAYGFARRLHVGGHEPVGGPFRERLRAHFAPLNARLTLEYGVRTDDWT